MIRSVLAIHCAVATALLCALGTSSPSAQVQSSSSKSKATRLATLTSDLSDYEPGASAVLKGSGFLAFEEVTVQVVHADGAPSDGEDHQPWTVVANRHGRFVTTWHVCEDDCVGEMLLATADGHSSGRHSNTLFSDSHVCGNGVVTAVTPVGASCVAFTPAVGAGPDNYEVVQGGTYTMTLSGVNECTGSSINVFVQSSGTGNFCFNATGGSGTYVGTFTMPNPACNTMPVSYKCGANAPCNHPNSFGASGPTSGCGGVHLRASTFNGSCVKTGDDADCNASIPTGACCLADGSCVVVTTADCTTMGGTYNGDSSLCGSVNCPQPVGACCLVDGSCVEVTAADCQTQGGTYQGNASTCASANCPTTSGACCMTDGSCVQVTAQDCATMGGTYNGDFSQCMNVSCPQPTVCYVLGFDTDDDGTGMVHGTMVDAEFDCGGTVFPVAITGSVNPSADNTVAILNSTTGPAAQDPDLLVGLGNILILQTDANETQCPANSGIYCTHNDDENGGTLSFAFCALTAPSSIVLVDIDGSDAASSVVLTDVNGKTRTYAVPGNWTGDKVTNFPAPGWKLLDLTTLANQPGFASTVTASQDGGFDPNAVVGIDVHLGGSGGVDDLAWCQ